MQYEIRFHGLGGEGVVRAAEMLGKAAALGGRWSQSFPFFGTELRGAPVKAFTRVSDAPVRKHCFIYAPDILVVTNYVVLSSPGVIEDLREDTKVIINAPAGTALPQLRGRVTTLDATQIGYQIFKRPIVNTVMLGALLKLTPIVSLKSVLQVIREEFPGDLAAKNIQAVEAGFAAVEGEV